MSVAGVTPSADVSSEQLTWPRISRERTLVFLTTGLSVLIALTVLVTPLTLSDGLATAMTTLMALSVVFILTPSLVRKMQAGGMVGQDVNKPNSAPIAELGGIAALFAFSVSLSVVVGLQKLLGNVAEPPFLAAISVFFMAATIGLIDDVSDLPQRLKAISVAFSALPLMLVHLGAPVISLPFGNSLSFSGEWHLFYWLLLVPIGVTGMANAMNMSAGYNGLETGQIAIVAIALLIVGQIRGVPEVSLLVFGGILGCALGLYYFNRFPARVFVGDIGTLGLGAALAAGLVLAHVEFYGIIAIAPAFYELAATVYYGSLKRNGVRKEACRNPTVSMQGKLSPPVGAGHYTLAYLILSKRSMSEKHLVNVLLLLYMGCGAVAVLLAFG